MCKDTPPLSWTQNCWKARRSTSRSANERSETGEIPSHIGSRVRTSLADRLQEVQSRPSRSTQMDPRSESSVLRSCPVCLRGWPHTLSHIRVPAFRTVQGAHRTSCSTDWFDGWQYTRRCHLPRAKEAPVQGIALTAPIPGTEPIRSLEEEIRDILTTAAKNQPEDGPNTRRAAVRACKYLRLWSTNIESTIQAVHRAARTHT